MSTLFQVVIVAGFHLFPFRTEKLSPPAPMVLHTRGRVGSRRFFQEALREQSRGASFVCDMVVCISKRHTSKMQTSHYTIAIVALYVCQRHTICLKSLISIVRIITDLFSWYFYRFRLRFFGKSPTFVSFFEWNSIQEAKIRPKTNSCSCISEHFIRLLKFSLKKNALVFADFGNMCTFASEN